MPTTVNGVGTRYFGRRNLSTNVAACEFCRHTATMSSYNTTLWFTVCYLPLIPLGKKRIFVDCSACRRHRAMPLAQWEEIQASAIAEARAAADAAPDDPAAAVNLLGVLYSCFQRDDAKELARELHDRFPRDVDAQMAAGDCLHLCGASEEAERAFLTALQLDAANPRAKRTVALSLLRKREPDTALRLISTAPPLEAAHDPGLFVELGDALAAEGAHDRALAAFQAALAAAPVLGNDRKFRRAMLAAEQATGAERSALPPLSWFRRNRAWLTAALIVALACLPILWNQYAAAHQTVHIVNGFDAPLSIRLEDGSQFTAPPRGHMTMTLAEGPHELTVRAGNRQLAGGKFEVLATVLDHFSHGPVFVLNPGCGATLLWEQALFGPPARAFGGPLPPQPTRLIVGQLFEAFPKVDYVFREFPRTIEVKGGFATKTRLIALPMDARRIVEAPDEAAGFEDRLRLAETHLRLTPNDGPLREAYRKVAAQHGQSERARAFLTGLAER